MPLASLSRPYVSRYGAPVLAQVETSIFVRRYFGACLACDFCADACCAHGVDVELTTAARILAAADDLEPHVGAARATWFTPEVARDAEFPGGGARRTTVVRGRCVFHNPHGRGCVLHAFCLETGRDYHELKPMVSALFPLTFADGVLCLADDMDDPARPLVCAGAGTTVYEAQRAEVVWYFGEAMARELDAIAARVTEGAGGAV